MLALPIDALLPEIVASLREHPTLVLDARLPVQARPPASPVPCSMRGSPTRGKSWSSSRDAWPRVWRRGAWPDELGEKTGATVGYQVRFEDVSSARTRVRFVTEGVLGRKLVASPRLDGIAVVVLDEFHERHLQGDVALALVERLRRHHRPELRVVVMSATLATAPIAEHLGSPVLRAEGRRFEVALDHLPSPDDRPLASQIASAVRRLVVEGLDAATCWSFYRARPRSAGRGRRARRSRATPICSSSPFTAICRRRSRTPPSGRPKGAR